MARRRWAATHQGTGSLCRAPCRRCASAPAGLQTGRGCHQPGGAQCPGAGHRRELRGTGQTANPALQGRTAHVAGAPTPAGPCPVRLPPPGKWTHHRDGRPDRHDVALRLQDLLHLLTQAPHILLRHQLAPVQPLYVAVQVRICVRKRHRMRRQTTSKRGRRLGEGARAHWPASSVAKRGSVCARRRPDMALAMLEAPHARVSPARAGSGRVNRAPSAVLPCTRRAPRVAAASVTGGHSCCAAAASTTGDVAPGSVSVVLLAGECTTPLTPPRPGPASLAGPLTREALTSPMHCPAQAASASAWARTCRSSTCPCAASRSQPTACACLRPWRRWGRLWWCVTRRTGTFSRGRSCQPAWRCRSPCRARSARTACSTACRPSARARSWSPSTTRHGRW